MITEINYFAVKAHLDDLYREAAAERDGLLSLRPVYVAGTHLGDLVPGLLRIDLGGFSSAPLPIAAPARVDDADMGGAHPA